MNDFHTFLSEVGVTPENAELALSVPIEYLPNSSPLVEFRSSLIHGIGMFSKVRLNAGRQIVTGREFSKWTEAGRFANHSETPNMKAVGDEKYFRFDSVKEINPGDELTVDYRSVRDVMKGAS